MLPNSHQMGTVIQSGYSSQTEVLDVNTQTMHIYLITIEKEKGVHVKRENQLPSTNLIFYKNNAVYYVFYTY